MPRARNRPPSPEPMEVEEEVAEEMEQEGTRPLEFNQPLTWKPGKAIQVTELLRRLKALSEELASLDQEDADRETLVPKAQELSNQLLLSHKDKGVKAYALLCVVEMFRLLAPDAPYKSGQLKEIFTLFTSTIVPALANPSDPYNQQHNQILASLTTVKSIILLTDIPGSHNLILNLFTNCFDVMSGGGSKDGIGEKLPKNLEYNMTNMLGTLVEESGSLPGGVVEITLAQFLRADPNTMSSSNRKGSVQPSQVLLEVTPAYNMARGICNDRPDKMSRAIGQYFSSVLIDASETFATAKSGRSKGGKRTHDESEDESDDGLLTPPAEDDFRELEKAHRLLRELWRSTPNVIHNVVPQIETEIEAESPQLRAMAVQTIGDMAAGIGAAGPPSPPTLDPATYRSQSLQEDTQASQPQNVLLVPNAPHAFSSIYPNAYQQFIHRYKDKAALVRSAWATAAGRILFTSGGGKGLDDDQEKTLLQHFSTLLMDGDERVRLAAVQSIAHFDFPTMLQRLGKSGSVSTPGSVLCNLADRIKDPKHHVRLPAMELLGRIWGVAAGAIAEGSERIRELFGAIPTKIFDAWYINDRGIKALIQRVLFDSLLPTTYPPVKSKQAVDVVSQRVDDGQAAVETTLDPDAIRAERILVLVRDLDEKAKTVFFSLQARQIGFARYVDSYLKSCEDYSGGNGEDDAQDIKKRLDKLVDILAKACDSVADPTICSDHLKKFAKHHDRRSYQLIRFCFNPESDYRKIFKAMKELTKRMEDMPSGMPIVLDTLIPLVRSVAILVYNRSHVPAIVGMSRTDEKGLSTTAHEVLKEISSKAPDIFKVHVHELCETLKKQVPSATSTPDPTIIDTLKACASFARRFPDGMPKDRDFYQAMVRYAVHGTPPKAAKHAVTVIASSADRKEMYVKELQETCIQNFQYGGEGFLSKLAAMSQLRLLANKECEDQDEVITEIAIDQVLDQAREVTDGDDSEWIDDIDEDLSAKLWALRILVNGLRGLVPDSESDDPTSAMRTVADPVYKLLNTLISRDGELSKSSSTPRNHKAHLRLAAAVQLLKLSCNRKFDPLLTQNDFNQLCKIAQDTLPQVRAGFVKALKKYLGSGALPLRFYGLIYLYAFEPKKETKEATTSWLKSRAVMSAKQKNNLMEITFPRFMSLLAHHQDFSTDASDLEDFVEYIMFYLKNVASEVVLPMIFHFAQRLKMVEDVIDPDKSANLYVLSDIAQAVIRQYAELQGWSLQVISTKVGLPSGLFGKLPSHSIAQEIAEKIYIPDELAEKLEDLVKNSLKTKKRKSDGTSTQAAKKAKASTAGTTAAKKSLPLRKPTAKAVKTPKKKKTVDDGILSSERRKSNRAANAKSYAENDESEDDEELEQWQEDEDEEANKENVESSTPPTSDPTPAPAPVLETAKKRTAQKESSLAAKEKPIRTTKDRSVSAAKGRATSPAAQMSTPPKRSKRAPMRNTRATRGKKEKDVMDVPSDSE